MKTISFKLNGEDCSVICEPGTMLVDILRDRLGLTGTKIGCKSGGCGACTVILDGLAVNSCQTPVGKVAGRNVVTIEGLHHDGEPNILQDSMIKKAAVQCGFCTPGIIVSAQVLLDNDPNPTPEVVHKALEGNICRCTGYVKVEEAIMDAAERMRRERHETL